MSLDPASAAPLPPSGLRKWKYFLPLLSQSRGKLAWAALAVAADAALTLCRPWPLKVVIDRVIHSKTSVRVPLLGSWLSDPALDSTYALYGACLTTLLIAAGTGWFTYSFTRTMGDVGRHFTFGLRRDLFAHMQRLSLRYHDHQQTGDLTGRLLGDIGRIQAAIASSASVFMGNALLLSGMVAVMFWLDWRFALLSLSLSPLLFFTVLRYTRRIVAASRTVRNSDGQLASLAQETLSSIRLVQGLAQEEHQDDRFAARNRTSLKASLTGIRYEARIAPLVDLLAGGGLALVMWYGARGVLAGQLTTGDVIVFFAYVTNLYSPMRALARLTTKFAQATVGAERVADVLGVQAEVRDRKGALDAPRLSGRLEFEEVAFSYDGVRPVLNGIRLAIPAGQKVAIVGSTGAGKTTLASLIPRLYDPHAGRILADGEDIRSYRVQSLREQIAIVLQEPILFRGTVRENIEFGRVGASEQDVVRAAKIACAHEFISALPDGYDTMVGERGATLSGGQRQRITIARAVVRDAPILILDEPTSGLDVDSERSVMQALERACEGRTSVVIAHRLSTLRFVDRIVVLREGEVIEDGTHQQLLSGNGEYARLVRISSEVAGLSARSADLSARSTTADAESSSA